MRRMLALSLAVTSVAVLALAACAGRPTRAQGPGPDPAAQAPAASAPPAPRKEYPPVGDKLELTDAQWKARLTPEQYEVLRKEGTERAFTGALWDNHAEGTYVCAGCGAPLFGSDTKFESGTGWPSFWQPIQDGRVATRVDRTLWMVRTEVHCDRCGGHLGHVFDDGPKPTGLRYCMNSAALRFEPKQ